MYCECGHVQDYHRYRLQRDATGKAFQQRPEQRLGSCMVEVCRCRNFREDHEDVSRRDEAPVSTAIWPLTLPSVEETFTPPTSPSEPDPPAFEAGGGSYGGGGASGSYDDSSSSSSDSGSSSSSDSSSSSSDSGSSGSSD